MGLCLGGLRQGRAIIGDELFDSLASELMLNVEAFPWLVENQPLIEDRLAGYVYLKLPSGIGKPWQAQPSKTFAGTVTKSVSREKQ